LRVHRRTTAAAVALAALVAVVPSALAGNTFRTSTTTAGGYYTYDADMINVENVTETGKGVYVAVLDTGLMPNWQDYFPDARVAQELGVGFYQAIDMTVAKGECEELTLEERGSLRRTTFIGSRMSSHGTHVSSTIIGFNYYSNTDAAQGFPLPPIQVRGIAPDATIIPVKVLADYQIPARPQCKDLPAAERAEQTINFGTDAMVAAGIDYVTSLAKGTLAGSRVVINMSLGDVVEAPVIRTAIQKAIAAGVIVVASAGNEGEDGMGWPGAYPEVISVGAAGWTGEWLDDGASGKAPANGVRNRMFWLQDTHGNLTPPLFPNNGDVEDPTDPDDVYVADFSSRDLGDNQDLDVLAPGAWIRGPFAGFPGYNHLPWWSRGISDLLGSNPGNFFYVGGTSMAAPHVAATAAMMLEKDPTLVQSEIETILESTALPIPAGSAQVWDPVRVDADGNPAPACVTVSWGADATGSGLVLVDEAIAALP